MSDNNRNGAITTDFGDGTYTFRLALGELEELQEKTDAGPFVVLRRLFDGAWRVADIRETIRLGLIGGGAEPLQALNLVRRYVDERANWIGNASIAQAVLGAALSGAPEEEAGKDDAPEAGKNPPSSQTDGSPSAQSTDQRPPAESAPPISGD
ncbi:gene transfer agent family protein [Pseudochelatococcus sp. B33]